MSIQGGYSTRGLTTIDIVRTVDPASRKKNSTSSGQPVLKQEVKSPVNQDRFVRSGNFDDTKIYGQQTLSADQKRAINEQRMASFSNLLMGMLDRQYTEPAEAVQDGGEYSADAVSSKIMNMAKALAGEDVSKIAILRDAVNKGFGATKQNFGNDLVQPSKDTYNLVMESFYQWENGE